MKTLCAGGPSLAPNCLRCHHHHVTMACVSQATRLALAYLGDIPL